MAEIKAVEQPICTFAQERGYHVRKAIWQGRRGAPDRLFFGHGESFFVEMKDPGEQPEPHQWREIARMRNNGIAVYVIDSKEAGCALFRKPVVNRHAQSIRNWPTPEEYLQVR